jgi:hypothetical protein
MIFMTRTQLRIRDTGLVQVGEVTPSRTRVNGGEWLTLYGSQISYDFTARLGMKEERALEDNTNLGSKFAFNDINHYGVKFPMIIVTGSLDTDKVEHQQFMGYIHELVRTQGIKEIEGDFLSYVGSPIYGRIENISFKPPAFKEAMNRFDYQIKFVRIL